MHISTSVSAWQNVTDDVDGLSTDARVETDLVPLVADVERRRRLLEHVLEAVLEPLLPLALLLQPLLLARLRLLDQLTNANHGIHISSVRQPLRKRFATFTKKCRHLVAVVVEAKHILATKARRLRAKIRAGSETYAVK